ncbi:sce7726 family protein [candidate division KSB1 bacterium]|nr:sce7726 family protein [candidate division KSB1 bacterium]
MFAFLGFCKYFNGKAIANKTVKKMNDFVIRLALKDKLATEYTNIHQTRILDEFGIKHGAARIDVIVINNILHGFEIKSGKDTLRRLKSQAQIYSAVLNKVTLVVDIKHLDKAIKIIPKWWGVVTVEKRNNSFIKFTQIRKEKSNPQIDILSVVKLLWRNEALDLLEKIDKAKGYRSKPRKVIYKRVSELYDFEQIQEKVVSQIKSRANWRLAET